MNKTDFNRKEFFKKIFFSGLGVGLARPLSKTLGKGAFRKEKEKKIGIVGLAVHSDHFTQILNDPNKGKDLRGWRVAALYQPKPNPDVAFTTSQLTKFRQNIKKRGVTFVDSMSDLLDRVDAVMIETNDGRPHLEQVMPVFKAGKPVFVDKPVAAHLRDVVEIFEQAKDFNVPIFSSSSLRYIKNIQKIEKEKVRDANTFSPAPLQKSHTDLFWYGIHGVEPLYAVMGTGCREVTQVHHSDSEDIVIGYWDDDRIGIFRGFREGAHNYGGTVFGRESNVYLGPFEGYRPLVVNIVEFFKSNEPPVPNEETIEVYAFMEAAAESKRKKGKRVRVQSVLDRVYNSR